MKLKNNSSVLHSLDDGPAPAPLLLTSASAKKGLVGSDADGAWSLNLAACCCSLSNMSEALTSVKAVNKTRNRTNSGRSQAKFGSFGTFGQIAETTTFATELPSRGAYSNMGNIRSGCRNNDSEKGKSCTTPERYWQIHKMAKASAAYQISWSQQERLMARF